ncbi:zeaxanthin epoxidase [Leptobacterium flavescens]|uniref:Zeaxanthin epoxidase n=1 Tax=Leptobacterium flavescens TaxID=472055 RepID=A0A6P0UJ95_9FLAO|nr:FAD-dependent monooxygenase [Leptobacterium flavescens]NER11919.1 zeaxanthin epoxidase [Leptobacterium flavescens]
MITIIGGGIGGLTTALAFEKLQIEYQLFEQAPQLNEIGAGIWLAPNALQVMEWLGLLGEVQKRGNAIDRIMITDRHLHPIIDNDQKVFRETFGYTNTAIHRASLQALLFEQLPKDMVHLGKAFEHYEYSENNKLKLYFKNSDPVETDYLIGADGIRSAVRKQLFPNSRLRYSGQTCWRGISHYDAGPEIQKSGIEMWGDQIRFGISQVAPDRIYWFAVSLSPPGMEDDKQTLKSGLLKMFSGFTSLVKELIQNTPEDSIIRSDINDLKPMKKWYEGNICLIGDAGHSTTPNMGQGGAQAIEDAYYLARCISEASNPETAFSGFQQKRFKKVNDIVKQSWSTGKMAHWKYGKGIRNFMLKSIPGALMKKKMLELYSIEKEKQEQY